MSKNLSEWVTGLGASLPLCPDPLVERTVLDVCRDFCARSRLWHEQLTAIDIVSGTEEYTLSSSNGDVASIRRAEVSESAINPTSEIKLDRESDTWRTQAGSASEYFMGEDRNIRLVYIPETAVTGGLVVWANLMPAKTATAVQDFLYNDHFETISIGARARLLAAKDTPWFDLKESLIQGQIYIDKVGEATRLMIAGRTPGTIRDRLRSRRSHRHRGYF